MEYVVNPVTVGDEKRSVGIDELVGAQYHSQDCLLRQRQ
jgi:hypothetical protein